MASKTGVKLGRIAILMVAVLLVLSLSAYGTTHNWFSFATGHLYAVDGSAPPPVSVPTVAPSSQASPSTPGSSPSSASASPSPLSDEAALGYEDGYKVGKLAAFKRGLIKGRRLGFKHGFNVGHNIGVQAGQKPGYQAGYPVGVKEGHRNGVSQLEREFDAWKASRGGGDG